MSVPRFSKKLVSGWLVLVSPLEASAPHHENGFHPFRPQHHTQAHAHTYSLPLPADVPSTCCTWRLVRGSGFLASPCWRVHTLHHTPWCFFLCSSLLSLNSVTVFFGCGFLAPPWFTPKIFFCFLQLLSSGSISYSSIFGHNLKMQKWQ